ncbi:hypothetical protein FBU30_005163 [Linnemannia zychae]|nr:hypothetical protein FBU30_005163 [Linnemannia zychae]
MGKFYKTSSKSRRSHSKKANKPASTVESKKSSKGSKEGASSGSKKTTESTSSSSSKSQLESSNRQAAAPGSSASKPTASEKSSSSTHDHGKVTRRRIVSDDESSRESDVEEESDGEDPDRQLGLRPTLRVVSKATIRKSWKPINVRTRTHIQSLVAGLFPNAITQSRGEKRKIEVQSELNRFMQKLNDCLSELQVPQTHARINYAQLQTRNRELEAMLVPDLEHIRDLELRIEQEQILAKQDEEELADFLEKKRALDSRKESLQRSNLHPLLKDQDLSSIMDSLAHTKNNYNHLSVADQRLMNLMPLSRQENFAALDGREPLYNPEQDVNINKVSKRLGNRLSTIEQHSEGLDPLMQLVTATQEKVKELSRIMPFPSTPAVSTTSPSMPTRRRRSNL